MSARRSSRSRKPSRRPGGALAAVKGVAAVRPGYADPPSGKPVPAVVVAVIPGTTPVTAEQLAREHATVEAQLAAEGRREGAFAPGAASVFEALLNDEAAPEEFG